MTRGFMHDLKTGIAVAAILAHLTSPAGAFCGFYVAQADSKLFNTSSKVVLARDGDETAITMASDYEGNVKEFAVVVPVPTLIERAQITVVDPKTIEHIDHYSAPRLVEYHDEDPCIEALLSSMRGRQPLTRQLAMAGEASMQGHGVTIEARYDVAEYDVLILSATESDGLVAWLTDNHYRIPAGAADVLGSYIKQGMHFFVAKVNLDRMESIGKGYLRPLQVRYNSAKFMVPLRLGTVNARGPQDLIIFVLSKDGRVESTNYRTVKVPSDIDVPLYVKDEFGPFYKALFDRAVAKENMHAVFVEYAWDMSSCDPCAATPLSKPELVELGARWTDDASVGQRGQSTYVTRLHVRYDAKSFPEDIALMETKDRSNFQGRYVQHHAWQGKASCDAARDYFKKLPARFESEAKNLADLTGWTRKTIAARMAETGEPLKAK